MRLVSARRVAGLATVIFLLVITKCQPWLLFARGGFSTDFYDAQARAMLHLRLDVPASIPGPEGFLMGSRTYLYFGPFLSLIRLPFALFGDATAGRLSAASATIAFWGACSAARHLAVAVAGGADRLSERRAVAVVAAVGSSAAMSLAGWNSVYHETELWAFALALATAALGLQWYRTPSVRLGALAGAAASCTVLTRSSVGLGAVLGLVALAALRYRSGRTAAVTALAALAGLVLSVLTNVAKFASAFGLPIERQLLTLQNPTRAAWFAGNGGSYFSTRFLTTTLGQYLRPDAFRLERLVPFVRFGPLATVHADYPLEGNTLSSSLPVAAAVLFAGAIVGAVLLARRRLPGMSLAVTALVAGGAVGTIPTVTIGFVAQRYLVDLLPPLVVLTAVTAAVATRPARVSPRAAGVAVAAFVVVGCWANVSFAVWMQDLKEPAFTRVRYAIDDAIFGGAPPSVVRMQAGDAAPRNGVVGIDGTCDGLYIAEEPRWVPLELGSSRHLRGTVTALPATLVTSEGSIVLDDTASWLPDQGEAVTGAPFTADALPVPFDVTSDPVTGTLVVTVGGHTALVVFAAPDLTDASPASGLELGAASATTPICDDLLERLDG